MEHVIVRWEPHSGGYWFDPRPYLEILPDIVDRLPPGARSYAEHPGHYRFDSDQCVKDLRFISLAVDGETHRVVVNFAANPSKHTAGLALAYTSVQSIIVDREGADAIGWRDVGWIGTVMLDEVLPVGAGMSHEIKFTSGTIKIVASDVEARWDEAEPAEIGLLK